MLDSVENPFVQMQSWFLTFERKRPPYKKGLPLWSLKVTDAELLEMQSILKRIFVAKEPTVVFNRYSCTGGTGKFDQIFTLYLATWIQRNFNGGKARWPVVLESINIKHQNRLNSVIYDSVKTGLKYWGIELHSTSTANQYFATLYCQGGFPRAGLIGLIDGPVSHYLDNVIAHYALFHHTSSLETIAENGLQKLPETLKQQPFASLACALITSLLNFRDSYHLYAVKDPVNTLNVKNPQWRNELPFLLCDEEAHELIGRLLNRAAAIVRRELHPVRIRRYLTGSMNEWELIAETYINQTIHPSDLSNTLGVDNLPVYFDLYTQTESGERARSASFNLKGQQNKRWQVLTKFTQFYNEDAASAIYYEIWSDGNQLERDCYYRGEELNSELPWVFSADGEQYLFIGQGNVKAQQATIFVLTSSDIKPANEYSVVDKVGRLENFNRDLYRVKGRANVSVDFGHIIISSGSEESQDYSCWLKGKKCPEALSHKNTFIGIPNVFVRVGDQDAREINSYELYWKTVDESSLINLNSRNIIYGVGNIVWIKDNDVKWQIKCAILPEDSKFEVISDEHGEVELKTIGLQHTDLGFVEEEKNWLRDVDCFEDIYIADIQLPANMPDSFHPVLGWNNSKQNTITFEFDSMQKGVCLLDLNGRPFTFKSNVLTLDDLYNHSLKIKIPDNEYNPYINISAVLRSKDEFKTRLSEHIDLESNNVTISCGLLAGLAQSLFSQSDDLYDVVTFKFFSKSGELNARVPKVQLFKHPVANYKTEEGMLLKVSNSRRHKNRESIVLHASPIWDLGREPIELERTTNQYNDVLFHLPESNDVGPWFVYANNDPKVQPRAVFISNSNSLQQSEELTPLQVAIRDLPFDRDTKAFDYSSMDECLEALLTDVDHVDWTTVQTFVDFLDLATPATFHVFKRLIYKPELIVALLLKQQEPKGFELVWSIAMEMPFEWLNVSQKEWISGSKLVLDKVVESISSLSNQLSLDQFYQIKCSVLQNGLQLLSDKGEYYSAIADALLFELFDIKPSWLDEQIYTPEGSTADSLIKYFHAHKSELFQNHEGHVLSHVQNKCSDKALRALLDSKMDRERLPSVLKGFIQHYSVEKEKAHARAITLDLPVKVALNNASVIENCSLDLHENRLINFALNRLQQFDRRWVQQSMAESIKAATIYKFNSVVE